MNDYSLLHGAAKDGDFEIAKQLIAGGAAVDSRDDEGRSPLHWAAREGQYEVAELLISSQCDLNLKDRDGRTPVLLAALFLRKRSVDLLLQHGAQVNCADEYGQNLLHHASIRGWADLIRPMLERGGADPNAATRMGDTPLMFAASEGHEEVAALLIRAGADVHRGNAGKSTALHGAACWGSTRVVQVLLEVEGLDLNPQDEDGDTPLHEAYEWGRQEVVIKQLLEAGADPNIKNNKGETVLSVCIRRLDIDMIRLLVQGGVVLQDCDYKQISENPFLKENVLKDVGLCAQSIVNKFHRQSLPALNSISYFARNLPTIDNFKLNAQQIDDVENLVKSEIERNGFCNVVKARPMALSALCVLSLITCQSGSFPGTKRSASPVFADNNSSFKKLHT